MPLDNAGKDLLNYKGDRKLFIETGTANGDGVASALTAGFEQICTVELNPNLANHCMNRFSENDNVTIACGSSDEFLPQVLEGVDEPFVLWLDAHFSGGPFIGEKMDAYLPKELASLKGHESKLVDSVIMIDDMGYFLDDDNPVHSIEEDAKFREDIENTLMELKPNGVLEYYRPPGTNFVFLVSK